MSDRPSTAVVWLRRDLRVHDHPALVEALAEHERVCPLFVFDPRLLGGRFRSAARTQYLLDTLAALDGELRERGGRLFVRHGATQDVVPQFALEAHASAVYTSADTGPYSARRDEQVRHRLEADGIALHARPGLYIADLDDLRTGAGKPYTVFSPFARTWRRQGRRAVLDTPDAVPVPARLAGGELPDLATLGFDAPAPELLERPDPGERGGIALAERWLDGPIDHYDDTRNTLAEATSRMSAHLRWGAVSALWFEQRVAARGSDGAEAYRTELAWRDFYAYVLAHFPENRTREFREQYRSLEWGEPLEHLAAWEEGRTGYPIVDAAMRQVRAMGWMHNRARMVVGSFLTKDLHLDWRLGEAHFMRHLLDGEVGSNNGGWQWVASTGTDPAPYFQRLFNPMTQQEKFDPDGRYVRRWCPELAQVPDAHLARPWEMTELDQQMAGCVIGEDYPAPIVDHAVERKRAIERYRAVAAVEG